MARSVGRPTIAILGGGVGGTILANLLARELHADEAEIVLVDRSGQHIYQPGWLYIPFGTQDAEHLERKERSLLRDRIKLIIGEAQQLDLAKQHILLAADHSDQITERLHYDYLVFASGARISPEEVPGLAEALADGNSVHHFYTQRGAERLHEALTAFDGGRIAVAIGGIPYKCPPAPLEFTFMLEAQLRQRGLRHKTEVAYYSPLPRAFSIESVSELATPLLEERGIKTEIFFNLEAINGQKRVMQSLEGQDAPYDLLVIVPPHRGALIAEKSGLADRQGWLPTDRHTLEVKGQERIYALGDVSDLPVSKSGSAAHFEAGVVAERITASIRGREAHPRDGTYDGRVMCFMETGHAQATRIEFDYEHPPVPPKPGWFYHVEKSIFNRAYWYLVPPARV
ncbi:MAG TPA: FAD/NAD(P)-binding oxidoreductase [Ktedonobacterales bacterium]|nr:FAD/NAD(P)-binding oxidoreductase [Ktedonobacterales bacterium]